MAEAARSMELTGSGVETGLFFRMSVSDFLTMSALLEENHLFRYPE